MDQTRTGRVCRTSSDGTRCSLPLTPTSVFSSALSKIPLTSWHLQYSLDTSRDSPSYCIRHQWTVDSSSGMDDNVDLAIKPDLSTSFRGSSASMAETRQSDFDHPDPKVSEIIGLLRRDVNGGLERLKEWLSSLEPFPPIPLVYDPILAKEDFRKAKHLAETLTTLRLAAAAATCHRIPDHVHQQFKVAEYNCRSLRNRAGMCMIPDDALEIILEYATHMSNTSSPLSGVGDVAIGTVAAMRLTHVCRRFRIIGIMIPNLWNRISNGTGPVMASVCCERAGKTNVEVFMGGSHVVAFFQAVKTSSENWTRFVHDRQRPFDHLPMTFEELERLAHETYMLQAPQLNELSVEYPYSPSWLSDARFLEDPYSAIHYYSTWTVPRLRSFTMKYLVPVPFSGSAYLETLAIELEDKWYSPRPNLSALIDFLVACPNLRTFSLTMSFFDSPALIRIRNRRHELGNVDTLILHFLACEETPVSWIFDHIGFPNVTSMELALTKSVDTSEVEGGFRAVLSEPGRFPRLESLSLILGSRAPFFSRENDLHISLDALTSVQDLTLSSRDFSIQIENTIPDGPCLPSIRSLSFKSCWKLGKCFVSQLLRRIKAQGEIPRLSVEGCQWYDRDEAESDAEFDTTESDSELGGGWWNAKDIIMDEILELVS
ncbi:hypothetical protein SCHPADRAFT_475753 [Schizopora paradoxa]|uniref:Uncharacterized protein n=1 Tax=Schizopora paradoxa TaxID=27342 RepID=A0A0H2RIA5_9AGAM|nr:hypothetical protein SCHPADRAFT_475753 [Schizopora paradoxa]